MHQKRARSEMMKQYHQYAPDHAHELSELISLDESLSPLLIMLGSRHQVGMKPAMNCVTTVTVDLDPEPAVWNSNTISRYDQPEP